MKFKRQRLVAAVFASLLLAGCLGNGETNEGTSGFDPLPSVSASDIVVVNGNYLPITNVFQVGIGDGNISWSWDNTTSTNYYNGTLVGMNFSVHHSAIDPDGTVLSLGWDVNLDGVVDVPVSDHSGLTTLHLPVSSLHEVPRSSEVIGTVAFMATDANGGLNVKLLDLFSIRPIGPWVEAHLSPGNYQFTGIDAQGAPSDGTEDNLIMLNLDQGADINLDSITVRLQIDGAAPVTCDNPGGSGGVCLLEGIGSTTNELWPVDGYIIVKESGTDLCSTTCSIDVTIVNTREGTVIAEVFDVPAE